MVKTKPKIYSIFLIVFLLVIMLLTNGIVVYADGSSSAVSVDSSVSLEGNNAEVANICTQANNSVDMIGSNAILSYSISDGVGLLTFSNKNYSTLDSEDKETFMETALKATTKTGLNAKTKNKVYNFIANQDTPVSSAMKYLQNDANADFLEAKKWIDPFTGVVGTVLGVLCVAIFMFTGLSIVFDICYLVLPGVQAILERGEENKKPFGVSREAYASLRDSERDNEYRSVLVLYLKRRVGLLIIMSVCVGYLISGKIYDVVILFIDAFS